jgi:hypothetical protein
MIGDLQVSVRSSGILGRITSRVKAEQKIGECHSGHPAIYRARIRNKQHKAEKKTKPSVGASGPRSLTLLSHLTSAVPGGRFVNGSATVVPLVILLILAAFDASGPGCIGLVPFDGRSQTVFERNLGLPVGLPHQFLAGKSVPAVVARGEVFKIPRISELVQIHDGWRTVRILEQQPHERAPDESSASSNQELYY